MALKAEHSIIGGVITGVLVYGVYTASLPSTADSRSVPAGNPDLNRSERTAEWMAASVAAGVSLIARDPTIFIIGGGTMVGLAWMHRHAVWSQPLTGKPGNPVESSTDITPRVAPSPATADSMTQAAISYDPVV